MHTPRRAELIDDILHTHHAATLELSPMQLRLMELFSHGHTLESAASELGGASTETLKSTAKLARDRLGARNTTHAVAICLREGIIE